MEQDEDSLTNPAFAHTQEETDLTDEVQDFRFLSALSQYFSLFSLFPTNDLDSHSHSPLLELILILGVSPIDGIRNDPTNNDLPSLPRRGEKDFELHGTNAQIAILTASRAAMHAALSRPRLHPPPKSASAPLIGTYTPSPSPSPASNIESGVRAGAHFNTTVAAPEYCAVVPNPRGSHFRTVGKVGPDGVMRLLPEEALYLLERGSLDLRWPVEPGDDEGVEKHKKDDDGDAEEEVDSLPLSLQAAYAFLIGRGGLTLERFVVYAGLKRSGYIVQRSPAWDLSAADDIDLGEVGDNTEKVFGASSTTQSLEKLQPLAWFPWLYRTIFGFLSADPPPRGPLVAPGLYRSYSLSPRKEFHPGI